MQIIEMNIDDVIPYANNPRKNDKAIQYVKESIQQFGFKQPIVIDKENVIVCGHTRYEAAKQLNLKNVPCVKADDLTEEQIKAYRLADNKTAEFSEWDEHLLDEELEKLLDFDMTAFGFFDDDTEEEQEEEEKPEIEFTEVLEEENNYIVLFFDNAIDWLQAESIFDLKSVKGFSSRKDGTGDVPKGVGRVLNGAEALSKLVDWGVNK
jgi:site-specific DNA-methyltransferase (adenine-specific)